MQLKVQAPFVHAGIELATDAQLRQLAPHAVTVVAGTQLPPQRLAFAGQVQVFRMVSQICPPAQCVLFWHPKTQVLPEPQ